MQWHALAGTEWIGLCHLLSFLFERHKRAYRDWVTIPIPELDPHGTGCIHICSMSRIDIYANHGILTNARFLRTHVQSVPYDFHIECIENLAVEKRQSFGGTKGGQKQNEKTMNE